MKRKRWAREVFAGSGAVDFMGNLVGDLVARVGYAVAEPARMEPDEYYGQVVPCIVALLAELHVLTRTGAIPWPALVASWKVRDMAVWEAHVARAGGGPAWRARRAALKAVFNRLGRLSRGAYPDG